MFSRCKILNALIITFNSCQWFFLREHNKKMLWSKHVWTRKRKRKRKRECSFNILQPFLQSFSFNEFFTNKTVFILSCWDEKKLWAYQPQFNDPLAKGKCYIKWQRVTMSGITGNNNEWQQVTTSYTTSGNKWQQMVQKVAKIENEWYIEWQRMIILAELPFYE